jgi:hypothetical protein
MDKAIKFLEKNAEWIAMGLGGLWVVWVIYAYGISSPVEIETSLRVPVGRGGARTEQVAMTPGNVDVNIQRSSVAVLKAELGNTVPPATPKIEYVSSFVSATAAPARPVELASSSFFSQPQVEMTVVAPTVAVKNGGKEPIVPKESKITEPTVPPPVILANGFTRSHIKRPDPKQPVAVGLGGVPAAPTLIQEDKDTVTVYFKWDVTAFAQEMVKANVPAAVMQQPLLVARVELYREEQAPNGNWGNGKLIGPLPINPQIANPPGAEAELRVWMDAVRANQEKILRPGYYDWVAGDKWAIPDQVAPALKPAMAPADAGGSPVVVPAVGPGNDRFYIIDESLVAPALAAARPVRPIRPPFRPEAEGPPPDQEDPVMNPIRPGPGVANPADLVKLPIFNLFWAHDDTGEEGKTYRYRARLVLVNPLMGNAQLQDPALANAVVLPRKADAGWCAWSEPVAIPLKTKYFVVGRPMLINNRLSKQTVTMEVFRWQRGVWNVTRSEVGPGDAVPGTSLTVVDIRGLRNWEDVAVILVDEKFAQVIRIFNEDINNGERKNLAAQAVASAGR